MEKGALMYLVYEHPQAKTKIFRLDKSVIMTDIIRVNRDHIELTPLGNRLRGEGIRDLIFLTLMEKLDPAYTGMQIKKIYYGR